MDRFSGVGPISLAAVFRRRSRYGCYMMTTITTVRWKALLHSLSLQLQLCGFRNACDQFVGALEWRSRGNPPYFNHCICVYSKRTGLSPKTEVGLHMGNGDVILYAEVSVAILWGKCALAECRWKPH